MSGLLTSLHQMHYTLLFLGGKPIKTYKAETKGGRVVCLFLSIAIQLTISQPFVITSLEVQTPHNIAGIDSD